MQAGWLDSLAWDERGLIAAIAQEAGSGKILMVAWMNREALRLTQESGVAVYWSRSRARLWRKGEESGHTQTVREIRTDCDRDVILLEVEQHGSIACHTGRHSCFFERLDAVEGEAPAWVAVDPVLIDPAEIYRK